MKGTKNLTIAIDGYSSCGKSTIAKELAAILGYTYIDSGAMYRAVTLYCLENKLIENTVIKIEILRSKINNIHVDFRIPPDKQQTETYLNGTNVENLIRQIEVSNFVSPVSEIGFVREAMVARQRELSRDKGVVMDGRDIGTVVFPDADLKVFMTADPMIRAKRRFDELIAKNQNVDFEQISQNIRQRDYIDSHRDISPLRKAGDAVVLDNTHMTREEQLEWIVNLIHERFD